MQNLLDLFNEQKKRLAPGVFIMPTDELTGPQLEFFTAINCKIAFNWLMSKKEDLGSSSLGVKVGRKHSSPSVEKPSIVTQFSSVMNCMPPSAKNAGGNSPPQEQKNNLFEEIFNSSNEKPAQFGRIGHFPDRQLIKMESHSKKIKKYKYSKNQEKQKFTLSSRILFELKSPKFQFDNFLQLLISKDFEDLEVIREPLESILSPQTKYKL